MTARWTETPLLWPQHVPDLPDENAPYVVPVRQAHAASEWADLRDSRDQWRHVAYVLAIVAVGLFWIVVGSR